MKVDFSFAFLLAISSPIVSAQTSFTTTDAGSSLKKCRFRPLDETLPIELSLPKTVITHSQMELPIEFHGLHPLVIRKEIDYGQPPKIIVSRYSGSTPPGIHFDEITETVTVTSASCASEGGFTDGASSSGTSSFCSKKGSKYSFLSTLVAAAGAAAAVMNENTRPLATLLAAGAVGGGVGGFWGGVHVAAAAAGGGSTDSCMPVVKVIVEAPAAYRGAVETCLDEINDPDICPDLFPQFPTCDDPEPMCKIAVVGAGAGGLYTALRMVDTGLVDAADVCIFEQTERVGGRLVSLRGLGPNGDLTIDAGGYRTWPQFTPTAHALITEYLNIPMDCYDDSDPCEVYNIVDENGKKAGFATFVEEMMTRLSNQGSCFYPFHELVKIRQRSATLEEEGDIVISRQYTPPVAAANGMVTDLIFGNGVIATATWTTILNIPQRPLLSIIRNSDMNDGGQGLVDVETLDALHSVQAVIAQKLYLYYPKGQVWWRQLGIRTGEFEWEGDARNMLLAGRYHDGPVYCDNEEDPDTCHGFLLAVYTNDLSGNKAQFFRRYQRDRPEPVTILANTNLEGAEFLKHAHQRLVDYHQLYNVNPLSNYSGFEASSVFAKVDPPPFAILSTWDTSVPWAGGAWHAWTDLDNVERAMQPLVDKNLFVVNEAYSLLQGWAEGSIKLADEILQEYFGIDRPWDFDVVDVNQLVRQTNSAECVEGNPSTGTGTGTGSGSGGDDDSDGSQSGGSSGGSGSGGGSTTTAEDAILCFAGESVVEMADGSFKKISQVRTGEFVATGIKGFGKGIGLVTAALKHRVDKNVSVAVVDTPWGELVGTPDHPVYQYWAETAQWVELEELQVELGVRLETRYIEAFYNLEVDGNILDDQRASHSYVVNGVMASGLGDHQELNRRFPRQKYYHVQQETQKRRRDEVTNDTTSATSTTSTTTVANTLSPDAVHSSGYQALIFKAKRG